MRTSALFCAKISDFSKFMVYPRGQGTKISEKEGEEYCHCAMDLEYLK